MEFLTIPQKQIISDTHRFRVVNIGRRGGKTTMAIEEMKACAFAAPRRLCYIAPTYQQARDIAWEALKRELSGIAKTINESRLEIRIWTQTKEESLIILRGWESVETLRGQAFDFIVIDEVAMMRNFWLNWQEVIRPTLSDTKGQVLFISTPKGFNHFYDLYNEEGRDNDFKSFHFTTYDNPHIPKEEVDKAKKELTEDRFAQEYLADFRKTEGLVYKEFSRDTHVFDETNLPTRYEFMAGVDFGYTNPAAIVSIVRDYDRNYWVVDEWYHTGKTEDEIADYVATQQFNKVYPDPENASAIEVLKRKKVNVREVTKGKDSVVSGIQTVRELFKANRLKIHKKCINLIMELETYSYPDKRDQRNLDEAPIKDNDHALDAVRYCLMMDKIASERPQATTFVPGNYLNPKPKPTQAKVFIPSQHQFIPRKEYT